MCGERPDQAVGRLRASARRHQLRKVKRRTALPFPNVDRYRLLKAATEVFLMIHCGVDLDDFSARRPGRGEPPAATGTVQPGDLEAQMRRLPHPGVRRRRRVPRRAAVPGADPAAAPRRPDRRDDDDDDEAAQICYGILAEKLANPCFLELLWSYWHDEGHLVQTLNAITWRFQNRTAPAPGRDPLAGLDIDPLRPLNNLLWGWIQDTQHRLTVAAAGLRVRPRTTGWCSRPSRGRPVRGADSRSRFIEAFHNLLVAVRGVLQAGRRHDGHRRRLRRAQRAEGDPPAADRRARTTSTATCPGPRGTRC